MIEKNIKKINNNRGGLNETKKSKIHKNQRFFVSLRNKSFKEIFKLNFSYRRYSK